MHFDKHPILAYHYGYIYFMPRRELKESDSAVIWDVLYFDVNSVFIIPRPFINNVCIINTKIWSIRVIVVF